MPDEARDVNPFTLDKNRRSTAPKDKKKTDDPREAQTVVPMMFTRPGEDYYTSDDPDAVPFYSDFRPAILPADSEVEVPGESAMDEEELSVAPKGSSARAFATSSTPSPPSPSEPPEVTAQPDISEKEKKALKEAAKSLEGVGKDNGPHKESESSTPTSSSTQETKDGNSKPPA